MQPTSVAQTIKKIEAQVRETLRTQYIGKVADSQLFDSIDGYIKTAYGGKLTGIRHLRNGNVEIDFQVPNNIAFIDQDIYLNHDSGPAPDTLKMRFKD